MFTLKNLGVPHLRGTGRGDMKVRAKVQVPTNLTEEQKRLFRELAKTLGEATPEPQDKSLFGKIKDAFVG